MGTVQEIESAIEKLSDEQVEEIRAWMFDREISRDAASGLLDSLADEAISDARAGRTKAL
jgi:Glu-tRNA(Gln) amidotransferase subunit E-like FAD-binding protein